MANKFKIKKLVWFAIVFLLLSLSLACRFSKGMPTEIDISQTPDEQLEEKTPSPPAASSPDPAQPSHTATEDLQDTVEASTPQLLFERNSMGERRDMRDAALSTDGQSISLVFFGSEIEIWDWQQNAVETYVVDAPIYDILVHTHEGQTLVAGYNLKQTADVWLLRYLPGQATPVAEVIVPAEHGWVTAAALSPDGALVAMGYNTGWVSLADTVTGEVLWTREVFYDYPLYLLFSPDGRMLLADSFSFDPHTFILNVSTGETEAVLSEEDYDPGAGFFSPDSSLLGWFSMGSTTVFETGTWETITQVPLSGYGFSMDNQSLFTAEDGETTGVVNVLSGELDQSLPYEQLSYLPDGTLVGLNFYQLDNLVQLWQVSP